MAIPKILVIPGSLRTGSSNARLAALAAKEFVLAEAEVTRISLEDYALPLFDGDFADDAIPPAAVQLKRMLLAHSGVFITCPEYNASVPPLIKNAIDWVTRVRDRGEPPNTMFKGRAFAIASVSRAAHGGIRGLMALRQILELGCGALVIPEQVAVSQSERAFDELDNLKDEASAAALKALARRLVELPPHYIQDDLDKPVPDLTSAENGLFRGRMLQRPDNPQRLDPRDRLIVALDFSSVEEARAMVTQLGDTVSFYKIGYQLGFAGGIGFSRELIDAGKQLFVDLKLHDIGNTVAQGVKSVSRLGAAFLTVHAYPQTMQAAVDAREGCLRILGVTVLTSADDSDLAKAGYSCSVRDLVMKRAVQARDIGMDGLVCSPEEVGHLRGIVGSSIALVTPGIRPAGSKADEQKRIATPSDAISSGADYLVVGRPVIAAADPKAAAQTIINEIALVKP